MAISSTPAHEPPVGPTAPEAVPLLREVLGAAQELHSAPELRAGLLRFAERLRTVVPYDTLAVLLLDDRGRELRFEVGVGIPAEVVEHWRFGLGQGVVGTAAREGRPVLIDDVRLDPRYIDAGDGIACELAVPLLTRGRLVGVLDLGCRETGGLTPDQADLLLPVAGLLASAIEGFRLHQATREQARRLSLLHEMSQELAGILDRGRLLRRVAQLVRRLVDYDVFSVWLWDEDRAVLVPELALDSDGISVQVRTEIPLGSGICGTAAAQRRAIRVPNVTLDPRFVACNPALDIRSELVVPLLGEGRLLGVLDVESTRYDAFDAEDEELLATLASSLAVALANADLYAQLQESRQRLEDDMAMARQIQGQLLPHATPWVPGLQVGVAYEPARELGGDFYDLLPFGDGKVALAVGDVSGKGAPAALYGSLAVGMIREYALRNHCCGPALVLSELNDRLRQLGIDNRFLALTFAVYERESRRLELASSGLPHPWLVTPVGGVRRLTVEGVPLGLLPSRSYEETAVELAPGSLLVIATDGLEESLNPAGEELGPERVANLLRRHVDDSPAAVARALLAGSTGFAGDAPAADDRTILVLKGV